MENCIPKLQTEARTVCYEDFFPFAYRKCSLPFLHHKLLPLHCCFHETAHNIMSPPKAWLSRGGNLKPDEIADTEIVNKVSVKICHVQLLGTMKKAQIRKKVPLIQFTMGERGLTLDKSTMMIKSMLCVKCGNKIISQVDLSESLKIVWDPLELW